jgi:AcrR family transcriptional regulator
MATAQPAGHSRREARARIETAATTLFHRDRIRSHRSEAANRTANVSKRTFYPYFSG